MTIALLSLSSCRQDLLPEKETYHNTSAFQLTSKRISLNEAKHKAKLLPELKKAEAEFKAFSKTNAQGKVVNYGNGVSIDTDDVIYIEKGTDFHSYTFHIKHENAPADAPVENLVLTVQEDGTYSELLLSYNFTQQEKQNLMIGIPVNAKGKVTITELAQGTYNNGGLLGKQVCVLVEKTMWNACSSGAHDGTNANQCEFINNMENGTPPTAYVVVTRQCTAQPVDYGLGENGENGGSGPQNGPGGLSNNPPEETTTAPNVPNLGDNPCRKTNASISAANTVLKNPTVQTYMDAVLKGKTPNIHEFALKIGDSGNSNYTFSNLVEGNESTTDMDLAILPPGSKYIGDGHSHAKGRGKPSAGDFYGMLNESLINDNFKYRYVYGDSDVGTDEIYALVIHDRALALQFLNAFPESENYDSTTHDFIRDSEIGEEFFKMRTLYMRSSVINTSNEDYHPKAVAMAYILDKFNVGISIAKADTNGNLKKINTSLEEITDSGIKSQRAKVSKCP